MTAIRPGDGLRDNTPDDLTKADAHTAGRFSDRNFRAAKFLRQDCVSCRAWFVSKARLESIEHLATTYSLIFLEQPILRLGDDLFRPLAIEGNVGRFVISRLKKPDISLDT